MGSKWMLDQDDKIWSAQQFVVNVAGFKTSDSGGIGDFVSHCHSQMGMGQNLSPMGPQIQYMITIKHLIVWVPNFDLYPFDSLIY